MRRVVDGFFNGGGVVIAGMFWVVVIAWSGCNKNAPECQQPEASLKVKTQQTGTSHNAKSGGTVSITGLVKQPIHLTLTDLRNYQTVRVRLNDVHQDASFHGVHYYRGVPLRVLLEQAHIAKETAVFNRELDLTIVVTNKQGEQVALSWGEIFYRNSSDILLAFESEPKVPHKACSNCHEKSTYKEWQDKLYRDIPLPKLVTAADFYSDRALEDVTRIEVVYLGQEMGINLARENKPKELHAKEIVLNQGKKQTVISAIDKYQRVTTDAIKAGDGTGYHGVRQYSGVSLMEVLSDHGVTFNSREVILLSAPDGYRVLLSSAELMTAASGKQILLADTLNGEKLDEGGRFQLVIPHDIPADRWLMAVAQIDILRLEKSPKLYVVGVGSGDTSLLTLEAISTIAKADVLIAPRDIEKRFAKYLGGRPMLYNSLEGVKKKDGKHVALSVEERNKLFKGQREQHVARIKQALSEDKTVAFLDYGDPTIFGTWRFLEDADIKKEQMTLIPGVSAVNTGNSILGRDIDNAGSMVVTSTRGLESNRQLAKALADGGETVAILVGLHDIDWTCSVLNKHFDSNTPAAIVYEAGYRGIERVVHTTIGSLKKAVETETEKHLGIIYIGRHI